MLDLKQRRIELGLTMLDVAKLVGVSEATISRYGSGNIKNMRRDRIDKYAKALQVSPSDFLDINEEKNELKKIPYSEADCARVPLIGRVAAGYSCLAEENISEYILTDSDILKDGYDYFWLKVKGDSMEPTLLEGDLVLVRAQNVLETPCLAVVTVDQEDGLVKYVDIDTHKITLNSVNPYYPPRIFADKEMNRVSVVGQVVESKRRY